MKKLCLNIICLTLFFSFAKGVFADTVYIVKEGDTLWEIALENHINIKMVIKRNPQLKNPNMIFPGQKIYLPNGTKGSNDEKSLSNEENKLLTLTNSLRRDSGLPPLKSDHLLSKAAFLKSTDMMKREYISHYSPSYGNPESMLKAQNITFIHVKENIGAGHITAEEIFASWKNSSANLANILDRKATHIGIGHAKGGLHGHYWTIIIIQR